MVDKNNEFTHKHSEENSPIQNQPLITITGRADPGAQIVVTTTHDNSFDGPGGPEERDEDPMGDDSDMMKVSHDSFAQFAASGDFMFDTQRCDFNELMVQLDKAEDKKLDKFDFQQLIQTMEDVDEFPEMFRAFLESCIDTRDSQMISVVLIKTVKAVL